VALKQDFHLAVIKEPFTLTFHFGNSPDVRY